MSDKPAAPAAPPPDGDDAEEILVKFRLKGALRDCPACGYKDWWVMDLPGQTTVIHYINFGRIPTYTLACQNCGYIQQHVRDIIEDKIKPVIPEAVPQA
jgi:C4-type Zn-finger protein